MAVTELWLSRHGESVANVAATRAERDGLDRIAIRERDADVPLSADGQQQAVALGAWMIEHHPGVDAFWVSPYVRARETLAIALAEAGRVPVVAVDERLRDRELGVLDLLTSHGVATRLPGEEQRRARLGKFYYRPPGGESWADVLLRLRSLLRDVRADHPDGRVVLFAHEAIVFLVRYLAEGLDEAELMAAAKGVTIANCSISSWRRAGGVLRPETFNDVAHLHRDDAPVTRQEEVHAD
jgi:broad specificity phosphatase PhoE